MARRTTRPFSELHTFTDFKESFIEPTFAEYLYVKFITNFRDIRYQANTYASVFRHGPFNEKEYRACMSAFRGDEEIVRSHMRLHSRTLTGWYLSSIYKFIRTVIFQSYKNYCDQIFDEVSTDWTDYIHSKDRWSSEFDNCIEELEYDEA